MVRRSFQMVLAAAGLGALLLCLMPSLAVTDDDDKQEKERAVTLNQLPAKVKATILKAAGKNKVAEVEEITLTLYEAEWVVKGKETEVVVTAQGKLLMKEVEEADDEDEDEDEDEEENEKAVTLNQIPAAAKAAILKLAGKNKITEVERVRAKFYEADWIEGKQEVEVLVAADGALISRGREQGDDDEDGDGEEDEDDDDKDDD